MKLKEQLENYIDKLNLYQVGYYNNENIQTYKVLEKVKKDIRKILKTS